MKSNRSVNPLEINQKLIGLLLLPALFLFLSDPVLAAATDNMPWEKPLETIMTSLTGPVAGIIGLIGITVAGGMLIFGGELGEFARRIVMLVLVLGLLLTASSFITNLFSAPSAVI